MKPLLLSILILFFASSFAYAEQALSQEVINHFHDRARQLKDEGRYEEAEVMFKQILAIQPENPNAHFDLGNVYLYQGKYVEAINLYKEAIDLRLDKKFMADYYFNLSVCYAGMGNNKEAINSIKQCLKLNPDYPEAENLLELYKAGGKIKIEPVD